MNRKENRIAARQAAEKAMIREEQNRRMEHAAKSSIKDVLKEYQAALCGFG